MKPKYLVFGDADNNEQVDGGALDFIGTYDHPFEALAELNEHKLWGHVAEFDGDVLVIVAERDGSDLKLYPERMVHTRQTARLQADAGGTGE